MEKTMHGQAFPRVGKQTLLQWMTANTRRCSLCRCGRGQQGAWDEGVCNACISRWLEQEPEVYGGTGGTNPPFGGKGMQILVEY